MASQPHILFLDAYDSFSHNIIALLEAVCRVRVTSIYIDAEISNFEAFLSQFSAVVCGPGPGHPACPRDVGLFSKIWRLAGDVLLPVLGICLGFQSLAHEFGASVHRLPQPRHGIRTRVTSNSTSIFKGLPAIDTVQYHSLYACLETNTPQPADRDPWRPFADNSQLQPLAWDLSSKQGLTPAFLKNHHPILMAVKHISKPFFGIQFHPESICSEQSARNIVANWWQVAQDWLTKSRSSSSLTAGPPQLLESGVGGGSNDRGPQFASGKASDYSSSVAMKSLQGKRSPRIVSSSLPIGSLTIPSICETLNLPGDELIILDAEMRQLPELGAASIVGLVNADTRKIRYAVGSNEVFVSSGAKHERIDLEQYDGKIFSFLKDFMSRVAINKDDDKAFCGGLMGYINYAACLETIGVKSSTSPSRPDIAFAFIERSILIDHKAQLLHIQELVYNDHLHCITSRWVSETAKDLEASSRPSVFSLNQQKLSLSNNVNVKELPRESEYKAKIARCKEQISAGESYELCLTDQSSISLKSKISEWNMYKRLRNLNPANFGAFVRLGPLTILSTSPERFMKWSRFQRPDNVQNGDTDGAQQIATCQFRPMKGTVRKRQPMPDGLVHHRSREEAAAILGGPKEQAENLMIVDLIRHDLYTVCHNVTAPGLMVIEDYESVYQMISVIEGKITKPSSLGPYEGASGIDCLAASLPPGSMTGAPKKRSCELLQIIEDKSRSIYAGVLGYMDISGKGDFSVLIRSMYKWDDEDEGEGATWHIGAGGAVTTLSTEEGEWQEMLTKLNSTFRLFET